MAVEEGMQIECLSQLVLYDEAFSYQGTSYAFDDVEHIKCTATKTSHSVNFIPTGTTYDTDLRVYVKGGQCIRIAQERGWKKREDRFLAVLRAAEILSEVTFTHRMERYEEELRARKFLSWDGKQFSPNGDLFRGYEFRFNLKDPTVDSSLGTFHLHCHRRPQTLSARIRSLLFDDDESTEISTDRDCFLFFMKNFVGLTWPNERIRSKRKKARRVFFEAVLKLGAKMAKADGAVSASEIVALKSHFGINNETYPDAAHTFREAVRSSVPISALAREVHSLFDGAQEPLEYVIVGLLKIAVVDGVIHDSERKLIQEACRQFEFDRHTVRRLFSVFQVEGESPRQQSAAATGSSRSVRDWYLGALGLGPDATLAEVKSAYYELVKRHHPDVLRAQGVPIDNIKDAEQVLKTINTAYEWLCRHS